MRANGQRRIEERLAQRGGAIELLRVPAALFRAVVAARRALYDAQILPVRSVDAVIVSVGNLTAGGTGKTPFCAWLVRELQARGANVGILSRGFGAESAGAPNDEALLLARLCPGVPHVQDRDRVRGARELAARGVEAIVVDDGFQHRRLARDLDLVLVDASRPFGLPAVDGRTPVRALLPRGLLREPPESLARADLVVVTRADSIDALELEQLEGELRGFAPGKPLVRAVHSPRGWRDEQGRTRPLEHLAGAEVDLASALGNPAAFEALVKRLRVNVREHRAFPDHHRFTRADLAGLGPPERRLVVSAKDAVKIAPLGLAFDALEIELEITSPRAQLDAQLEALLDRRAHTQLHAEAHG